MKSYVRAFDYGLRSRENRNEIVEMVVAASFSSASACTRDPGPLCGVINLGRGSRASRELAIVRGTQNGRRPCTYRGSLNLIGQVESLALLANYLNIGSRLAGI